MTRSTFFVLIVALFLVVGAGCSSNEKNPLLPQENVSDMSLPVFEIDETQTNRELIGTWTIQFDPENQEQAFTASRNSAYHENVIDRIPDPVITINSYDPVTQVFDVDVTLIHPCSVDAYDVRLIIYTDDVGHMLLNADDWTNLYDIPGGDLINPFKAYAKNEPNRIFAGWSQHTENLLIYQPDNGGVVFFAVDASRPGNCEEAYSIENFTQGELLEFTGASTEVSVDVLDWQDDVAQVYLYCPAITNELLTPFSYDGAFLWTLELVNETGAGAGEYPAWIIALNSIFNPLALYEDVTITISEAIKEGWAVNWEKSRVNDVAVDSMGNIYAVGIFEGITDFDPGPGWELRTSNGDYDAYLCKYDSTGNFIWVRTWGSTGIDIAYAVQVGDDDRIYVAGTFNGTCDFDPGPGVREFTSVSMTDMFVSRYFPNGDLQCIRATGGEDNDQVHEMAFSNNDEIYLVGNFDGDCDFAPGNPEVKVDAIGHNDCFLAKYTLDGYYIWVKNWGNDLGQHCSDVTVSADDEVYVTGYFRDTLDFDPGSGVDEKVSNGVEDVFLSKFDTSGNYLSAQTWGNLGSDWSTSLGINNSGDILVGGTFEYWVDFDPGPGDFTLSSNGLQDIFLSKFNSSDIFEWAISMGGTAQEWMYELCIDSNDYVYLTGCFHHIVDFDPGSGVENHISNGEVDIYLAKYDSDGGYIWSRSWGGTANDIGKTVITDPSDYPIIGGEFKNVVDFDPGPGIEEHTAHFNDDAFIMKLKPNGYWY